MDIPIEDFRRAVQIANSAGKRGNEVNITYIPTSTATVAFGSFVVDEYQLSATGERA